LTVPETENNSNNGDFIIKYDITGVNTVVTNPKHANYSNPTISLGFGLSYLGIPQLNKAELIMEEVYEVPVKYKKEKEGENKEGEKKEGETKEESSDEKPKEDKEEPVVKTEESTKEGEEKKEDSKPIDETEFYTVQEKRTRKHTYKLDIERSFKSHKAYNESKPLMKQGRAILKLFNEYEETKLRTAEAKNRLESLMYSIPEITDDESFTKYGTLEEVEGLKKAAND